MAAPSPIYAEQREVSEPAFSGIATFEEVWRTVRDRFYDPQFRGLNWDDVRDRYIWEAARATSQNELAGVINRMLSQLRASHTPYYTSDEPEYYQLADIFTGALRRRGLERAFPSGRVSYPGIGILSRTDQQRRNFVIGVIEGTPAERAGLVTGDEIVSADDAPFQPVGSFRDKIGEQVVLMLRRNGQLVQVQVIPASIEPNKMFLEGMQASARVVEFHGRRLG